MREAFAPRVATASALVSGETVYLSADGRWAREIAGALVAASPQAAAGLLERATRASAAVVGVRLIEVEWAEEGVPVPIDFRERMRLGGPTVGPVRFHC